MEQPKMEHKIDSNSVEDLISLLFISDQTDLINNLINSETITRNDIYFASEIQQNEIDCWYFGNTDDYDITDLTSDLQEFNISYIEWYDHIWIGISSHTDLIKDENWIHFAEH